MTPLEITLLAIFGFAFLVQIFYYLFFFSRLATYKITEKNDAPLPPVSVVIAARDEYHHLIQFLPLILNQDYPDFEVVVVNHASDDETDEYLKNLTRQDKRLKYIHIERDLNFFSGKKFPLSLGIKSAAHEVLLLTDADCKPVGTSWIKTMVRNYSTGTEVVLGYGPFIKTKGFLNLLCRYDTFHVALQYFSFALGGLPYMGVGRNLSYTRSLFFKEKGFTSHYKIISGDDDLFINQASNKRNTRIEIDPESFMYSRAKETFGSWRRQKLRHFGTGGYYKFKFKVLLGLYSLSQLLFFLFLVILLSLNIQPLFVGIAFLARLIVQFVVHKKVLNKLDERQLLLFSLVWEVFHLLIVQLIALKSMFRKNAQWK